MKALPPSRQDGFTVTEFLIAAAITLIVAGGMIYAYITGLRMYEITRAKLGASDDSRKAIAYLVDEIRSATEVKVGEGSPMIFNEAGITNLQLGNSIQIHATTNASDWVRYFWNSNEHTINRLTSANTNPVVIVNQITNSPVFTAEDFLGNIETNSQNNRVIGINLMFSQIPSLSAQPDFYQLRFRVTRRRLQ